MKNTETRIYAPAELDAVEARFALRVTARLTEQANDLSPDVSERLRFAREQALARARLARTAQTAEPTFAVGSGTTLSLGRGDGRSGWWIPLGSVLPLIALVAGLALIQQWHESNKVFATAEIDASLLADDLPPDAYSDPGFLEFLKDRRD